MRLLGLDLGERRVGIALSDDIGMLAHPLTTLSVTNDRSLIEGLRGLVERHTVERIVVGMPYNQDGTLGPRAARSKQLCELIAAELRLPVADVDERFTSQQAQRALEHAPRKVRRDKGALDQVAATIILQHYLDSER